MSRKTQTVQFKVDWNQTANLEPTNVHMLVQYLCPSAIRLSQHVLFIAALM